MLCKICFKKIVRRHKKFSRDGLKCNKCLKLIARRGQNQYWSNIAKDYAQSWPLTEKELIGLLKNHWYDIYNTEITHKADFREISVLAFAFSL